jgi:hypothetical protein
MQAMLPTLLEEFREKIQEAQKNVLRKTSFPEAQNLIKVATGMRRVGKTYTIFQKILELLDKQVPLNSILYINFEDDRLLPMDYKELGKLVDDFYTLFPENHSRECHIFLDEVQNVSDWAITVRRFFDSKKVQLYLTGSSAKLLSKEIATSLRGRALEIEIWPYCFSEFMSAHAVSQPTKPLGKKTSDELRQQLLRYLDIGGFPAVQFLLPAERKQALQGYVETVNFRDIIERHNVSNISLLRYTINSLMKNVGAPFSINKFHNDITSQGHKASKDTLYSYLRYIEDAYLLFAVPHFNESFRLRHTTPKKIYAIDTGLLIANTFNTTDNYGKLFENLIFLDLRRTGKEIFYYKTKNGFEVDFIVTSKHEKPQIIQAVWDMQDDFTRQREERALAEAQKELGFEGKIIDLATYLNNGI